MTDFEYFAQLKESHRGRNSLDVLRAVKWLLRDPARYNQFRSGAEDEAGLYELNWSPRAARWSLYYAILRETHFPDGEEFVRSNVHRTRDGIFYTLVEIDPNCFRLPGPSHSDVMKLLDKAMDKYENWRTVLGRQPDKPIYVETK